MDTTAKPMPLASNGDAQKPFYSRVAALGFALLAMTAIAYMAFGLMAGDAGELVYIAPAVLIFALLAAAVLRLGTKMLVVAALLSCLLLILIVPFSPFALMHPESAADFVPAVLSIAGSALAFLGSAGSLVQRRRHTLRLTGTRGEVRVLQATLSIVALLGVFSLVQTALARAPLSTESKAGAVSLAQKNFAFAPAVLDGNAGQMVRVVVRNADATLHTFTLDEAKIDVSIPPGAERLIEFKAPATGAYAYYCIPHSDSSSGVRTGMVGTLTVR